MNQEALRLFQAIFTGLFLMTLIAGGYLVLNFHRFFGPDPNVPSENSSSRSYSRMQALMVWLHATLLTGAFALLLH
jgi:hypothetical protein